ncbi:hypothetical protein [Janibacter cremeus]|uniref:Gram-positive cocci surface proteins LPxTG domain-containing protein n=1 Tax=Janibacter cremeus TaxID=1285192 RepID=A0A852VIZ7_9MICO|nr:hypothetical protein [Janibacter cremeus]NYF97077.1 hypothetical protein [Janibacter cremeus]
MGTLKRAGFITGSVALTVAMAPGSALAADCGSPARDAIYKTVHHDAKTERVVDTPAHTVEGEHHPAVTHVELEYGIYTPGETTTEWVREGQEPTEGYTPTGEQRTVTDQEAYDDPDTTYVERKYVMLVEDGGSWDSRDVWSQNPPGPGDWEAHNFRQISNGDGQAAWTETVDHPAQTHQEHQYRTRTYTDWFAEGEKIPVGLERTGAYAEHDGVIEWEYTRYEYLWFAEDAEVPDGYERVFNTSRTVVDTPAWTETIEHEAIPETFYVEYQWRLWQPEYTETFEWFQDGQAPDGWDPTDETREVTTPGEHHPAVTHEEYEYSHTAEGTTQIGWFREGEQPEGWTLPFEGPLPTRTVIDEQAWTEDDVEVPATYATVTTKDAFDEEVLVQQAVPAGEECVDPVEPVDSGTTPQLPAVVQTDGFSGSGGDNTAGLALGGLLLAGAGAGVVVVARRRQDQS